MPNPRGGEPWPGPVSKTGAKGDGGRYGIAIAGAGLQFTPVSKRLGNGLNGKTVTFVKSPAGTAAKGIVQSSFIGNVYLKY